LAGDVPREEGERLATRAGTAQITETMQTLWAATCPVNRTWPARGRNQGLATPGA